MKDNKYIVFKRDDWERWVDKQMELDHSLPLMPVEEVVVIRLQDVFAGPALHAYSSSVSTIIETLEAENVVLGGNLMSRLHRVRDYFFEQALAADDVRTRKVPD